MITRLKSWLRSGNLSMWTRERHVQTSSLTQFRRTLVFFSIVCSKIQNHSIIVLPDCGGTTGTSTWPRFILASMTHWLPEIQVTSFVWAWTNASMSHIFFKSVLIWLDGPNHETTPNQEKQIKSKLETPLQHWSSFYSRTKTALTSSKFDVSQTFLYIFKSNEFI